MTRPARLRRRALLAQSHQDQQPAVHLLHRAIIRRLAARASCYNAFAMGGKRVVILDYGAGNLRSVARAVEHAGFPADVSADPRALEGADAVVMPGVGAAADTMRNLQEHGFVEPLREYIAANRPFLGVCMGMQALLTASDEGGDHPCLNVIAGRVRRLPSRNGVVLKIPHMGWNSVSQTREHPVFAGIPDESYFYFVHGYYPDPEDASLVIGRTEYGVSFASAIARDALVATQFHPEKSGRAGLQLYHNFLAAACGA
jgi:glutamine amidotransferase